MSADAKYSAKMESRAPIVTQSALQRQIGQLRRSVCPKGEHRVNGVCKSSGLTRPTVSHHGSHHVSHFTPRVHFPYQTHRYARVHRDPYGRVIGHTIHSANDDFYGTRYLVHHRPRKVVNHYPRSTTSRSRSRSTSKSKSRSRSRSKTKTSKSKSRSRSKSKSRSKKTKRE